MKNRTMSGSFRITKLSAGMLLIANWGCDSATQPSGAPTDEGTQTEISNAGHYTSIVNDASDPGLCGYNDVGTDTEGRSFVEEERYYFPRINSLLSSSTELQVTSGLTSVTNCDEARRFMRAYNAQDASNQGIPTSDKSALLGSLPVAAPEVVSKPGYSDETQKIYNGQAGGNWEVVGWSWQIQSGANKGRWKNCTAVRLSGTLFLTAAHCFSPTSSGGQAADTSVPTYDFDVSNIRSFVPGNLAGLYYASDWCNPPDAKCKILHVTGYMNLNYLGGSDYKNDLAVIYVKKDSQASLRNSPYAVDDFGSQHVAWIATKTPTAGTNVSIQGWGPIAGKPNTNVATWEQRYTESEPIVTVGANPTTEANNTYLGTYYTSKVGTARVCVGDSGSPSYKTNGLVNGTVSVASSILTSTGCAATNSVVYTARLDWQFGFLNDAMYILQNNSTAHMCYCWFVPDAADSTGVDYEADFAHLRCNFGCESPYPSSYPYDDSQW